MIKITTPTGFLVPDTTPNAQAAGVLIRQIEAENPGYEYMGPSTYPDGRSDVPKGRYLAFGLKTEIKKKK